MRVFRGEVSLKAVRVMISALLVFVLMLTMTMSAMAADVISDESISITKTLRLRDAKILSEVELGESIEEENADEAIDDEAAAEEAATAEEVVKEDLIVEADDVAEFLTQADFAKEEKTQAAYIEKKIKPQGDAADQIPEELWPSNNTLVLHDEEMAMAGEFILPTTVTLKWEGAATRTIADGEPQELDVILTIADIQVKKETLDPVLLAADGEDRIIVSVRGAEAAEDKEVDVAEEKLTLTIVDPETDEIVTEGELGFEKEDTERKLSIAGDVEKLFEEAEALLYPVEQEEEPVVEESEELLQTADESEAPADANDAAAADETLMQTQAAVDVTIRYIDVDATSTTYGDGSSPQTFNNAFVNADTKEDVTGIDIRSDYTISGEEGTSGTFEPDTHFEVEREDGSIYSVDYELADMSQDVMDINFVSGRIYYVKLGHPTREASQDELSRTITRKINYVLENGSDAFADASKSHPEPQTVTINCTDGVFDLVTNRVEGTWTTATLPEVQSPSKAGYTADPQVVEALTVDGSTEESIEVNVTYSRGTTRRSASTDTENASDNTTRSTDSAKTGDTSKTPFFMSLLLVAGVLLVLAGRKAHRA